MQTSKELKCANCCRLLQKNHLQGPLSWKSKKIKAVLTSMYKLNYTKLLRNTIQKIKDDSFNIQSNKNDTEEELGNLCTSCNELLDNMTKLYDNFNRIRSINSILGRSIQKLDILTEELQSVLNHNEQGSPTIKIEAENDDCVVIENKTSQPIQAKCTRKPTARHPLVSSSTPITKVEVEVTVKEEDINQFINEDCDDTEQFEEVATSTVSSLTNTPMAVTTRTPRPMPSQIVTAGFPAQIIEISSPDKAVLIIAPRKLFNLLSPQEILNATVYRDIHYDRILTKVSDDTREFNTGAIRSTVSNQSSPTASVLMESQYIACSKCSLYFDSVTTFKSHLKTCQQSLPAYRPVMHHRSNEIPTTTTTTVSPPVLKLVSVPSMQEPSTSSQIREPRLGVAVKSGGLKRKEVEDVAPLSFGCSQCGEVFETSGQLSRHKISQH